ncbi:hypothetical protein HDU96_002637, partial [Phlyctochytrium bullatum]
SPVKHTDRSYLTMRNGYFDDRHGIVVATHLLPAPALSSAIPFPLKTFFKGSVPITLPAGTPLAAIDYDELPSNCNFVIPPKLEDDVAFVLNVAG